MKKFILAAALVAAMAPAAVAQDEFAPEKGDFGVELQFNPFSNDYTTFRDSEYGLTGRYFITNKDAIRLNIGFGVHKDIDNTDFETSENNYVTLHNNTRRSNFNINLGYERHPRKSHGQRSLAGYSSRGCKESHTTEHVMD